MVAQHIGDLFCTMRAPCANVSERPTGARPKERILPCGMRASRIGQYVSKDMALFDEAGAQLTAPQQIARE